MRRSVILALAYGPFSMAVGGTALDPQSLTVLAGDQVGMKRSVLTKASEMARRILSEAGISTEWSICIRTAPGSGPYDLGSSASGRPDLFLRILPKPMRGLPTTRGTMGTAAPGNPGDLGAHAYIYYDRVLRAADVIHCDAYQILGHAMAHEIGHLLGNDHSRSGIMSADWSKAILAHMSRGDVRFTPDGTRNMQVNVMARLLRRNASQ